MLSFSVVFTNKSIKPPPLMFSWEIYEFFKAAEAVNGGVLQKMCS